MEQSKNLYFVVDFEEVDACSGVCERVSAYECFILNERAESFTWMVTV